MKQLVLLILIPLLWGCNKTPLFHESVEIKDSIWRYDDSLKFDMNVVDTLSNYDMHMDIEHTDVYSYQNIYLKIITNFPGGKRMHEQLSVDLAEKSGQWLGHCKGDKCKIKVYLLESFRFPEKGNYSFIVKQHTRDEPLEGINKIGFSVFKQN